MTTVVCVCHFIRWVLVKVDWTRGHAHYVSKWTGGPVAGTGGPVAGTGGPVAGTGDRATGRPATRRPVQVDPAAAPAAGWLGRR